MTDFGPLYTALFAPECDRVLREARKFVASIGPVRHAGQPKHRLLALVETVERECPLMLNGAPCKHPRAFVELAHVLQIFKRWSSDRSGPISRSTSRNRCTIRMTSSRWPLVTCFAASAIALP